MSASTAWSASRLEWMSLMIAFTVALRFVSWSAYPAARGGVKERIHSGIVNEAAVPAPLLYPDDHPLPGGPRRATDLANPAGLPRRYPRRQRDQGDRREGRRERRRPGTDRPHQAG